MPPRRFSQRLHPDEGLPQAFDQNQLPFHQPSTQTLSTIVEGSKYPTFRDIPELQLHKPATMSTTAVGSSQNDRGTSSTQTNRGDPRQSPPWVLSPVQDVQGNAELDQIQVQHWDEEAKEDNAASEEEELARVQQEIERLL
jgi:hypothetical protein